ncbi:MAG: SMP-30/gluconolactonase/LRE family protein [Anaerolineae bacterium]|nr:SMP-30/gluconolactonase/LRE family protein [Anaerolineae bacterium]
MVKPELIADYQCVTGEGPIWHPDEGRVYWLDIPMGKMFRYDPTTGKHEQCYQGESVGGLTVQADGTLLLFMNRGAIKVWRDGFLGTILPEIPEERDSRFNDVIADPRGRVFCGTMATKERLGRLYRLNLDGTIEVVLEGVKVSNGMGFTPDRKQMYYTDSGRREIYIFDYDEETGNLTNRRLFVRTPEGEGVPDGLTVDAEGYVWSARWDGGCLVRYAPDGTEDMRIQFPAKKVSSVIFGGEDYTDIYVTTAGGNNKEANGPGAGALFRINLGIRGVPEFRSRVKL